MYQSQPAKKLKPNSSRIIAIEGLDGVGKETVAHAVVNEFRDRGYSANMVSFPRYETPMGRAIKSYLEGAYGDPYSVHPLLSYAPYVLDMNAFMLEHPFIDTGLDFLVMDRAFISNVMYQGCKFNNNKDLYKYLRLLANVAIKDTDFEKFFYSTYFLKLNEEGRLAQLSTRESKDKIEDSNVYSDRLHEFTEFMLSKKFADMLNSSDDIPCSEVITSIVPVEVNHVSGSEAIYEESKRVAKVIVDDAFWDLDDNDYLEGDSK